VAYEICFALALGLAHDRAQALELGMVNYLWPSLTVLLAVLAGQQKQLWLLPGLALSFAGIVQVMGQGGSGPPARAWPRCRRTRCPMAWPRQRRPLWAAYSVLTRRHARGQNAVPLFLLATGALLWAWFGPAAQPPLRFSLTGLAQVLTLAGLRRPVLVLEPRRATRQHGPAGRALVHHAGALGRTGQPVAVASR
jgi:drug/metabolite transporter (DMT)-like permease